MSKIGYRLSILMILMMSGMALAIAATEQVAFTIYVHEADLNGTMLSDVTVTGEDAAGKAFEGITDSDGIVTIPGQTGTWQFTFEKEGYGTVNLNYDVTETSEAAAYLLKVPESNEQVDSGEQPSQSGEQPYQSDEQVAPLKGSTT